MEIIRVFSKKRLIIIVLLLIANGLLFIEQNDYSKEYTLYDNLICDISEALDKGEDIQQATVAILADYKRIYNSEEAFVNARKLILEKVDYIKNYNEIWQSRIEQANSALLLGIFSNNNSFSHTNIVKYLQDMEHIRDVQVKLSNGIWLDKIVGFIPIYFLILLASLVIVYSFVEDRRIGMVYLQYAAANGRGRLFLKRISILVCAIMIITFIFFTEIATIALVQYGGIEGLGDSVCCDEQYAMNSIGGMARGFWYLICVVRIGFAIIALSLLIWAILTSFNNYNIGICVSLMIIGTEYVLSTIISDKSIFRIIKYFNLRYLLDSGDAWFTYKNWGYENIVTDLTESTSVLMLVISGISCGLIIKNCVCSNNVMKIGKIERLLIRISEKLMYVFARLPHFLMELRIELISKRMIIIILIAIVMFLGMNVGNPIRYNYEMNTICKMCDEYKNASVSEILDIKEDMLVELQQCEANEKYKDRAQLLKMQVSYLDYYVDKKNAGIDVALLSQYDYNSALGETQERNQLQIALWSVTIMIFLNIGIVSYEKKQGTYNRIRAASERSRWVKKKIMINLIVAISIMLMFYVRYYQNIIELYELQEFNASIQSLRMFSNYCLDIPIWLFVALDTGLKTLLVVAIGGIAYAISSKVSFGAGYFCGVALLLPHFLYLMGLDIFGYISLPKLVAFMPFWLEGNVNYNIIADIAIIVLGNICYAVTTKKIDNVC